MLVDCILLYFILLLPAIFISALIWTSFDKDRPVKEYTSEIHVVLTLLYPIITPILILGGLYELGKIIKTGVIQLINITKRNVLYTSQVERNLRFFNSVQGKKIRNINWSQFRYYIPEKLSDDGLDMIGYDSIADIKGYAYRINGSSFWEVIDNNT